MKTDHCFFYHSNASELSAIMPKCLLNEMIATKMPVNSSYELCWYQGPTPLRRLPYTDSIIGQNWISGTEVNTQFSFMGSNDVEHVVRLLL